MFVVIIRSAYLKQGVEVKKSPAPYGPFESVKDAASWLMSVGFTSQNPQDDDSRAYIRRQNENWAKDAAIMEVRSLDKARNFGV